VPGWPITGAWSNRRKLRWLRSTKQNRPVPIRCWPAPLVLLRAAGSIDTRLAALLRCSRKRHRIKDAAQSLTHYPLHRISIRSAPMRSKSAWPPENWPASTALPWPNYRRGMRRCVTNCPASSSPPIGNPAHAAGQRAGQLSGTGAAAVGAARHGSSRLAKEVSATMQELGMAGGRFVVDVTPLESSEPAAHGIDRIEFRVSTNPGQPPRAVAKIASGGELARLSLAVQVSCTNDAAPCMVFDEVDAGIGGAVAEIVGRELRRLGAGAQVLCVTHLPHLTGHRTPGRQADRRQDHAHSRHR
jgi:hypothetical protein